MIPTKESIKAACELYARIWEEVGGTIDSDEGLIGFKDEENHAAATATIFIGLTDPKKNLGGYDNGNIATTSGPSFDPATKKWNTCPVCRAVPDSGVSEKGQWYGCRSCQIWLRSDGKTTPMKPKS